MISTHFTIPDLLQQEALNHVRFFQLAKVHKKLNATLGTQILGFRCLHFEGGEQ
jgi:hypothetical protein